MTVDIISSKSLKLPQIYEIQKIRHLNAIKLEASRRELRFICR